MATGTFETEAVALTELLRDNNVRSAALSTYLDQLPVAVLMADDAGFYVAANDVASRLTGYSRAELLTRSIADLTAVSEHPVHDRLWSSFARGDGQRQHGLYRVLQKNGEIVTVHYEAYRDLAPGVHASFLTPRRRQNDV